MKRQLTQTIIRIACLLPLLGWCFTSLAQSGWETELVAVKRGSEIEVNPSSPLLEISDPFVGGSEPVGYINNRYVDVRLRLDESERDYFANDWALEITYTIKFYDISDNFITEAPVQKLKIDYKKASGATVDRALNRYENKLNARVFVTNISFQYGGVTYTDLALYDFKSFTLEAVYGVERYRLLSNTLPDIWHTPTGTNIGSPANNRVTLNWENVYGAQSYDLEWMFVDVPPNASFSDPVDFDWRDATRINTAANSYEIALVYPRGIFVYRVRGVGKLFDTQLNKLINDYGHWTRSDNSYYDVTGSGSDYFQWNGFEPLINWTSAIDYAEEGKKKEIVSFYDGSGRMRQTVTMLNTESNAVVAETYYDHAGRATVNTLPVPVKEGWLHYYPDFNGDFNRDNFDEQQQLAVDGPDALTTGTTAEYYSGSNPFLGDAYAIQHIPDADGFPYIQTRVLNDGTGRPHSTGGVGYTHRLKSGHETKYFYASPNGQEELDRLFGTEAGFVANYKKNMTVDANKQVSVTYLDGYGRTVATALAGDGDQFDNLKALTNVPEPETLTVSLLAANTVQNNVSTVVKDFLVSSPGAYTFEYALDPADVDIPCWTDNTQKPCKYDLSVRIYQDVDGELYLQGAGIALTGITQEVSETLTVSLDVGKYVVVKELSISGDTLDTLAAHLQHFLQPNPYAIPDPLPGCFSFTEIVSPCMDCAQKCTTSYTVPLVLNNGTTISVYRNPQAEWYFPNSSFNGTTVTMATISATNPNIVFSNTICTQLQSALDACLVKCESVVPTVNVDECTLMRQVMLGDMEPAGQYFSNKKWYDQLQASADATEYNSILTSYTSNSLGSEKNKYFWINTLVPDALQSDMADMAGITWADDSYSFWEELESRWDTHIRTHANYATLQTELLTLHPEYCTHYYFCLRPEEYCCNNTQVFSSGKWEIECDDLTPDINPNAHTSNEYDLLMNAVPDFTTAVDHNWFNPLNIDDTYTYSLSDDANPVNSDPFFCPNGWAGQNGFTDMMLGKLMRFYPTPGDSSVKMSIYEVLAWDPLTYTPPPSPPTYHDDILAFLIYLHGDGVSVPGILDDNVNTPTLVGGQVKMSRWQFFRQEYYGLKKQIMKLGYTTWAKENCASNSAYPNFPLSSTECGALNPSGDLNCANGCYLVSRDQNGDLQTDGGTFAPNGKAFDGFDARYQFYCIPNSIDGMASSFCDNLADAYVYQWLNQMENPYIGCVSADTTLAELLALPTNATIRSELIAYLKTYFLYACQGQTTPPPSGSSPANFNFAPLPTPVAISVLFPSPQFGWDVPAGLTTISSPADILAIFKEEFENNHSLQFHCPDELYTPPMGVSPTIEPGDVPEMHDVNDVACPCSKFAEWIMNTDGAFESGLTPTLFNPIRYEAFGQTDLSFLELSVIQDALDDIENGLGTSLNIGHFIGYCRHPEQYGQTDINGFDPTDIPDAFKCRGATSASEPLSCEELNALTDGINTLNAYRDSVSTAVNRLRTNYTGTCLQNIASRETFTMQYALNEYHYTLYYYDQAGNLIKTVPPAGVKTLNATQVAQSIAHRQQSHTDDGFAYDNGTANTNFVWPAHRLVTNYRYNSSNQPTFQHTPDGGDSRFWYDKLGRMVLSQNAKQATPAGGKVSYSYTLYDSLGRISEVGQLQNKPAGSPPDADLAANPAALAAFIGPAANRKQVTRTFYDTPTSLSIPGFAQRNVRNRVSRTEFAEEGGTAVNFITYYSYDIHGNVNELVHQPTVLQTFNRKFIKIKYEYDLVSGNVNQVTYQPNMPEMFMHKYAYDADNRITEVHTSRDNVFWDLDAKYFYYPHGPLARIEIGEKQVQGVDYAYTLHGWLKAVNGIRLGGDSEPGNIPTFDMGRDGMLQDAEELHTNFARDAYAFALFYYGASETTRSDYTPIGDNDNYVNVDREIPVNNSNGILGVGLFNGNITAMTTALRNHDETLLEKTLRKTYQYDQLNRLVQSNSFIENAGTTDGFSSTNGYYTEYAYDANGNIRHMKRKDVAGDLFDDLDYAYNEDVAGLQNNRLKYVTDAIGDSDFSYDFDGQASGNYAYDAIGNLVSDAKEEIQKIDWNVYGKVKSVIRTTGSSKPNLEFFYDASGQRYAKVEKPLAGTAPQAQWKYTFYLRDAQGNPLCIYKTEKATGNSLYELVAAERPIYGSARLGMDVNPASAGYSAAAPTFSVGIKPNKYDKFLSPVLLGAGTITVGEGIQVKTLSAPYSYTPEDFMYYRSEGSIEVTYDNPMLLKNIILEDGIDVDIYTGGTAYTWTDANLMVHDGEWYVVGGTPPAFFTTSAAAYDADSADAGGGIIKLGPLTVHNDSYGIYAVAAGTTGYLANLETPSLSPYVSVTNTNDEFVFLPTETDTLWAENGTVRIRASAFYTTNMRADEFATEIPDSIGYAFDESVLILPGGQQIYKVFNAEIYQREDSLEKTYTNSTITTPSIEFKYWSATQLDGASPLKDHLLFMQQVDSVTITALYDKFVADSFQVERNDTLFTGFAITAIKPQGMGFSTSSISIPGFGPLSAGIRYTLKWLDVHTDALSQDTASIRFLRGNLEKDIVTGEYILGLSGKTEHIQGVFQMGNSTVLAPPRLYTNVSGRVTFADSIKVEATGGTLAIDNIFFDPVIAHAGISCGLADTVRSHMLNLTWLQPWVPGPVYAYHGARFEAGSTIVTLDSIPPSLPDTGYCNIEYNYGSLETNSGVIIGLSYVMIGNEMHIAYSPTDTLHLPFAATWRTETGVYFRNPFIYSDSSGCYIESRDAVRFYANLNILNLPYDNDSPGVSELLMFSGVPTTRVQANASTPSLTVPMATVTAVDSLGYIVYEGLHSFVSKDGDELVFTGDAIRTNYLYLGASADSDTVAVMDRAAYVTYADFRMAVGTLMLESTDTLFGVYTVKDIPVKTDRAQFNVASGILIATGTHWTLKSTDITDMEYNVTSLKQVTAYRPGTAGVAERVIADSQYPEYNILDNTPDLDNTAAHYKIPGVMIPTTVTPCKCFKEVKSHSFAAGKKIYELSNHLGNVLATISDRKLQHDEASGGKVDYYLPDVLTVSDYDPFGAPLHERTGQQADAKYRYQFNGKEFDNEGLGGGGSTYDYGFRIYNANIGRFLSVDPISKTYPMYSSYQYAANTPIWAKDVDGLEAVIANGAQITIVGNVVFVTDGKRAVANPAALQQEVASRLLNLLPSVNAILHKGGNFPMTLDIKLNYILNDDNGKPFTVSSAAEFIKNTPPAIEYYDTEGNIQKIVDPKTCVMVVKEEFAGSLELRYDAKAIFMPDKNSENAEGVHQIVISEMTFNPLDRVRSDFVHEVGHFLGKRGMGDNQAKAPFTDHPGGFQNSNRSITSTNPNNVELVPSDIGPMINGARSVGVFVKGTYKEPEK